MLQAVLQCGCLLAVQGYQPVAVVTIPLVRGMAALTRCEEDSVKRLDMAPQSETWRHQGLRRREFLRFLAAGTSAASLAALVAACGGSAATPTTSATTSNTTASSAATSSAATTSAASSTTTTAATTAAGAASSGGSTSAATSSRTTAASSAASSASPQASTTTAAAQTNPFGPAQKKGGTYVVVVGGTGGYPQLFRPETYYGSLVFWCCKLLFTPLIILDRNWEQMLPGLATSWDWSSDQKQLTVKLRKGVKFHDGQEFTAKDVDFTYKLMVRKETAPAVQDVTIFAGGQDYKDKKTETFAGLDVIDDYTVRFNLTSSSSVFLLNVSNTGILPMHGFPADVLTNGDDIDHIQFFLQKPFGTGPFKLKSFDIKTNVTFEAFPDYWRGAPNLDGIIFRLDAPSPAMISGMQAGQFDGAYVGALADAATLKDQQNLTLSTNYSLANEQVFIVAAEKPYMNVKVRQALITALDVDTLAKTVGYGFPKQAPSMMMYPSLFPNPNLPKYDFSVDKAKQLLQEGNWNPSQKLVLGVSSTQGTPDNIYAAMLNMWKAVGIDAQYKPFDPANNTKTWLANPHEFDIFQTSYAWLAYDPSSTYQEFASTLAGNYSHYNNPQYDDLMKQAIRAGDPDKAKTLYQQVQVIMGTDLPYIPIWIEPEIWAINKKMHGGNLARGPLNDIQAELWWKE
jgi:peptide/nickel transport system substrate-binding protein